MQHSRMQRYIFFLNGEMFCENNNGCGKSFSEIEDRNKKLKTDMSSAKISVFYQKQAVLD